MSWSIYSFILLGIPSVNSIPQYGEHFQNYHRGLQAAKETSKPLIVIMNPGAQWNEESVSIVSLRKTRERRGLLKDYVVVIIDTTTPHGRIVHDAYGKPKLPHVAILGKQQRYLIFTTSNQLYGQRWTEILTTYRKGAPAETAMRSHAYCPT